MVKFLSIGFFGRLGEGVSAGTAQIFGAGFCSNCVRFGAEVLVNRLQFGVVGFAESFDLLCCFPRQGPDLWVRF